MTVGPEAEGHARATGYTAAPNTSVTRCGATTAGTAGAVPLAAQNYSDDTKDPRPEVPEGTLTAGSLHGPISAGHPVVSGPAPEAITILQPLQRSATGHLGYGKCRFVMILCPYLKLDVEFEPVNGDTLRPTAKVAKVSRPYFEPKYLD